MEKIFNLFMSSSSEGGFTLYQKRNNKTPSCDSVMFDLCVGPIKGGIGSEKRKQWLFANSFLDEDNDLDDANKSELKQKSKLGRILRQNKSIRFWVSSNNIEKLPEIFETINRWGEEIKRPSFLPGEFPHLLINGNYEIPGHDETRVYAAIKAYSENNEISDSELHNIIGNSKFADDRIIVEENFEEYHKTGKGFVKYRYPESKKIYEVILQNRVLVDGEAKIVNLKEMIQIFVEHQKRTELRIKKFELEAAQKN